MAVLSWVNYLSVVVGVTNFFNLIIITTIVLRRNPKEKINWLFAMSFFFIAVAYVFLPIGAFVYTEENPDTMLLLTKIYGLCLFIGLVLLMLSSVAFNYGSKFVMKWFILIPSIIVIVGIALLLFALNDTEGIWYAMKASGGETANIETSLAFTLIFYPICGILAIIIYVFFSRAYKQTNDKNIRRSLAYFIIGLSVSLSMLIPNILSNVLADIWENAQILNGLEFILVAIGVTLMLVGFLVKSRSVTLEQIAYEVPITVG
ncbi:MAG TPA: hypothetical protein VMX55_12240 [candidate division Zixibacteria bacterium]|nr:hypothetical protein [candidate division Zixibacteria bacterium]